MTKDLINHLYTTNCYKDILYNYKLLSNDRQLKFHNITYKGISGNVTIINNFKKDDYYYLIFDSDDYSGKFFNIHFFDLYNVLKQGVENKKNLTV